MSNPRSALLGTAFAAFIGLCSANAADLSSNGCYKDPCFVEIWSGPYFGLHGGGAWSSVTVTDVDLAPRNTFRNDGSGGFGGGTWGWNWQWGAWVTSAEFDLGVLDVSHSAIDPAFRFNEAHMTSGVYGDVTARIGYAFDRALVYAKGGFGFFNGDGTVKSPSDVTFKTNSFTGWTAGAGVEYKLTPNWSVKAEYLHFDFGDQETHVNGGSRWNHSVSLDTVKAGVNYELLDIRAPLK